MKQMTYIDENGRIQTDEFFGVDDSPVSAIGSLMVSIREAVINDAAITDSNIKALRTMLSSVALGQGSTLPLIKSDFQKIVMCDNARYGFGLLRSLGILPIIAPQIHEMASMKTVQHKDVWDHTMTVFENGKDLPKYLIEVVSKVAEAVGQDHQDLLYLTQLRVRLSLLLHDIGKSVTKNYGLASCPSCNKRTMIKDIEMPTCKWCMSVFRVNSQKRVNFRGHEKIGSKMAAQLLKNMGFNEQMVKWVQEDCALHGIINRGNAKFLLIGECDRDLKSRRDLPDHTPASKTAIERLVEDLRGSDSDGPWGDLNEAVRWHIMASDSSAKNPQDHKGRIEALRETAQKIKKIRKQERAKINENRPLVDGATLQYTFSIPPGPWIGEAHRRMQIDRISNPSHDKEQAIAIAVKVVKAWNSRPDEVRAMRQKDQVKWLQNILG